MFVFLRGADENEMACSQSGSSLYTRHYTLPRLISVCLILIAGLTSFVICLPKGGPSRCEKSIFCRRISGGVIAIGVHYIIMIHSASAHQSRLNKFFISCCIRLIFHTKKKHAQAYSRLVFTVKAVGDPYGNSDA